MFDPSQYHGLTGEQAALVQKVAQYAETYFQDPKFDASHDFNHVLRVTGIAIRILDSEQEHAKAPGPKPYNPLVVILGALLHDVDDRKYRSSDPKAVPEAQAKLLELGLEGYEAARIQSLVDAVSYSSEVKNPQRVRDLLIAMPELGIVQDADRLDAMGAIGIGRCFSYGAAKTTRDMAGSMEHFDDKLLRLADMMKTQTGRELGTEYTARLEQFKAWWQDEIDLAGSLP
jgi:uncharacterized protein